MVAAHRAVFLTQIVPFQLKNDNSPKPSQQERKGQFQDWVLSAWKRLQKGRLSPQAAEEMLIKGQTPACLLRGCDF